MNKAIISPEKLAIIADLRQQIDEVTDWTNPGTKSEMHTGSSLYHRFGEYLRDGIAGSMLDLDIDVARGYIKRERGDV